MFQKDYWERDDLGHRRPPQHPVVSAYVLPKIERIRRFVEITDQTTLLDVGCGNGFFTYHLDKICDVTGVDFSEKMLELNPVKRTLLMDAAALEFEDRSFDVVFSHAVLHHVEDMDRVLSEMRRVSRKYVVFLEPNRTNPLMYLFCAIVAEERKACRFSLRYLKQAAARNGLTVEKAFSSGMVVPNKVQTWMLPVLRFLDFSQPLGMTNSIIARSDLQAKPPSAGSGESSTLRGEAASSPFSSHAT